MGELYALLDGSMEAIKEYFQRCAETPFLCGKNRRGWTAGLDFLLDPSKYANIMEGKYDDGRWFDGSNGASGRDSGADARQASSLAADCEAFERQQDLPREV